MMGRSADRKLVERAKEGRLSTADVDAVAERLRRGAVDESTYDLLYVVSRARATRHQELVASFLDCADDPMLARLALQTLCSFWGLSAQYLDFIKRFVAGVDWDHFEDVRQVALSAAGEYLRENTDCELFRGVHGACVDSSSGSVGQRIALEALARALGKPMAESLDGKRLMELKPELLADGSAWLAANCANDC
ncbi:hypothetical protein Kfla_1482 [Kribbella flavida DSM 17836]|uniref:PBS lyase HEAT domain protein repeat-containing protein n=1 Tax=Kribbella flavida (strain DSM 17836 / JCM 10339 / NBRC 14399) TaxID=479435 RepID=D2PLF4_KRIFD|nr:hypothetical protein Kfla_1482 [Kribbella flavida DSM 17836]